MQSQGLRVSHSVKLTLACTSRAVGAVRTVASSGDPDVVPNAARPRVQVLSVLDVRAASGGDVRREIWLSQPLG